jgi:hypothetical protein
MLNCKSSFAFVNINIKSGMVVQAERTVFILLTDRLWKHNGALQFIELILTKTNVFFF